MNAPSTRCIGVSGTLRTATVLEDEEFHIKHQGLKLVREVNIYQTVKHVEAGDDKSSPSTYITDEPTTMFINEWCGTTLDTRPLELAMHLSFEERNKNANEGSELFHTNLTLLPNEVKLGAYDVSAPIIHHPKWGKVASSFILPQTFWPEQTHARGIVKENSLYLRKQGFSEQEKAAPQDYHPQIGDLRLRWRYIPNELEATIVAQQDGSSLKPIKTSGHNDFFILEQGIIDVPNHLASEQEEVKNFSSILSMFMFFFFWPCYAIIFWGVRFGSRQSAFCEGWMAIYKYGSSALLACITTIVQNSCIMLYQGKWLGLALLALGIGLALYLRKKALNHGKTLVFSGPTREEYDEDSTI